MTNLINIFIIFAVGGVSASPTRHDVCDEVYRSLQLKRSSGVDTPSPIDVNFCLGMVQQHGGSECTFDVTTCHRDCGVVGFELDELGCQISCNCKSAGLFEEDIKYDAQDVSLIERNYVGIPKGVQEAASVGMLRWNQKRIHGRVKVPYVIDDTMSIRAQAAIKEAFGAYSTSTCIDFVERVAEKDYIQFVSRGGCWSYIGRRGGRQDISIGNGCEWSGVVQHELMHALGFWHEQSRPDRDEHVVLQMENVMAGKQNNFNIRNSVMSFGSPYDTRSLMHYGGYAFSKNLRPTILIRETNEPVKAQRDGFTAHDLTQINAMYECTEAAINSTNTALKPAWSQWGIWTDCSVTCGSGVYARTRTCRLSGVEVSDRCDGPSKESMSCEMKVCLTTAPSSGSWSQWQSWGSCSKSCGTGSRWRKRQCFGGVGKGKGCEGPVWESSQCNRIDCSSVSHSNIFGGERWEFSEHVCRYGNIHSGDFNGDGRCDLLCYYSDDWTVVYLATSSGRFSTPEWQRTVTTCKNLNAPGKLVIGDLNGDGRDDLMCQDPSNGAIRVTLTNKGGFGTSVNWKGSFPEFCNDQQSVLMLHDVNGDSLDDLVCKTRYGKLIVLYNQYKYVVVSQPGPGFPELAVTKNVQAYTVKDPKSFRYFAIAVKYGNML